MKTRELATEVQEFKNASSLKLKFNCGLDDNGKDITKTRTYSNLKATANSLDIYNVALALESLQKHTMYEVIKQDSTTLN